MSESSEEKSLTYEYGAENRLKAVREGGRLLMAVSYDGDGNRALDITLRSQNQFYESEKKPKKRTAKKAEEEEDEVHAQAPVGAASQGTEVSEKDEPVPEADDFTGEIKRELFVYGALSYLHAMAYPYMTKDFAAKSGAEIYWYFGHPANEKSPFDRAQSGAETTAGAETETPALLSGRDGDVKSVVERIGLTESEEARILSAKIPALYDGKRDDNTYELTRYVNDINRRQTQVLMEYTAGGGVKTKYTYGNERLFTSNAAASGVRGQTVSASYIADGKGSVSMLYGETASTIAYGGAAETLASYAYGPFGETVASVYVYGDTLKSDNSAGDKSKRVEESFYAYNQESYSPLTGLQYLRARYYDPEQGRFTTADTYPGSIYEPLTQNLYSYAGNDPINHFDPAGHKSSYKGGGTLTSRSNHAPPTSRYAPPKPNPPAKSQFQQKPNQRPVSYAQRQTQSAKSGSVSLSKNKNVSASKPKNPAANANKKREVKKPTPTNSWKSKATPQKAKTVLTPKKTSAGSKVAGTVSSVNNANKNKNTSLRDKIYDLKSKSKTNVCTSPDKVKKQGGSKSVKRSPDDDVWLLRMKKKQNDEAAKKRFEEAIRETVKEALMIGRRSANAAEYARRAAEGAAKWEETKKNYTVAWPVENMTNKDVSSEYGPRKVPTPGASSDHNGIDIKANLGQPVLSAINGEVTFIGYDIAYGYLIKVKNEVSGIETWYAHNSGFKAGLVKGSKISLGETIAYAGSTGVSTGTHVHFEVHTYYDGKDEMHNPIEYLPLL